MVKPAAFVEEPEDAVGPDDVGWVVRIRNLTKGDTYWLTEQVVMDGPYPLNRGMAHTVDTKFYNPILFKDAAQAVRQAELYPAHRTDKDERIVEAVTHKQFMRETGWTLDGDRRQLTPDEVSLIRDT